MVAKSKEHVKWKLSGFLGIRKKNYNNSKTFRFEPFVFVQVFKELNINSKQSLSITECKAPIYIFRHLCK